jgi:ligand-binding SRPBCC domain-containing protein
MITITDHPTIRGAYQLRAEQWLPPFLNFQVLTPKPVHMFAGTRIDYRLRLHGIPIRWKSEISEWDPPRRFVDRQLSGPYRLWHHLHTFEEVEGRTLVRDVVDYSVPGGRIVNWLFVRRDLTRIFTFRRLQLEAFFGK